MLWSVKNGVLPFGGLLGALISGWIAEFSADYPAVYCHYI